MTRSKTLVFLFLQFFCISLLAAASDSLAFISDVKKFAFTEIGVDLKGDFYTKWSKEEKPYIYLYVSLPDKVQVPKEINTSFIYCETSEEKALSKGSELNAKGYQTFCYKTYANSAAMLNKRLLSYSKADIAFIIFHELIHNYISQLHLNVPYEFNEAMCDVIGHYETLKYSQSTKNIDLKLAKAQVRNTEKIYKRINSSISKINKKPAQAIAVDTKCNKAINKILKRANIYQRDRFEYTVNNAYLLKNEYYCKNYFLLKKVYLKQKSLKDFLEIMKKLPGTTADCVKYLQKFS